MKTTESMPRCHECSFWERNSPVLPFRCGNTDSPAVFIQTPPLWGCVDFKRKAPPPKRVFTHNLKGYVRMTPTRMITALALTLILPALAAAQQIPPPTGPVTFCGTQAAPAADSYRVQVDGGTPQPLTMVAAAPSCPAGATHSFTLAASLFTVGKHSVRVTGTNAFGSTVGPEYIVTVGIAPGQFTVTAVVPPGGGN
mgnify:CR=1 FL=1